MKNEELGFGRFDDCNQESDELLDGRVGCVVLIIGHEVGLVEELNPVVSFVASLKAKDILLMKSGLLWANSA